VSKRPPVRDLRERVERGQPLEVAVALLELAPRLVELAVLAVHLLGLGLELEVGGDQALEVVARAIREDAQQREQRAGDGRQLLAEARLGNLEHQRVVERAQGGGALARLDERHLAEAVAGPADGDLLAALRDDEVARQHHVHRAADLALVAERLAGHQVTGPARANETASAVVGERLEQPRPPAAASAGRRVPRRLSNLRLPRVRQRFGRIAVVKWIGGESHRVGF
jgi:hypothetical protein